MPAKISTRFHWLAVACGLLMAGASPVAAQSGEAYTISGEDGYGISECMHAGSACGRVIADSWCESHGHAHAMAYGMASDVTGSTGMASTAAAGPEDVVIRCGD